MKTIKILLFTLLTTISIGQSFGDNKGALEYFNKVKKHIEFLGFSNIKDLDGRFLFARANKQRAFQAEFLSSELAAFGFNIYLTDYAKNNPKELLEFLDKLNGHYSLIQHAYTYNSATNIISISISDIHGYTKENLNHYLDILDFYYDNLVKIVKSNKKFKKLVRKKF